MLRAMQLSEASRSWDLEGILAACDWSDQAVAVGAGHGLQNHGLVEVAEETLREIRLDAAGEQAVENGLLEARLWAWMQAEEAATMQGLQASFERHEAGPGVGLLKQLGVEISGGQLVAAEPDTIASTIASSIIAE